MPTPKGGKVWNSDTSQGWTDKRGYRWRYITENGRRRARREHRVIMEAHLGRRLEPWELVHHKDGDPLNNAIENLEVMEFGAHAVEHSVGSRRSADARRSMEAFALLREELRSERAIKSELLEALRAQMAVSVRHMEREGLSAQDITDCTAQARAAIAKATGGEA